MSNAENTKKELEYIEAIISNAHAFAKGKTPSVTDVLRSYDDFITKNKISSTSQAAQNVYKVLLRAARKKGEDWLRKIKNDSQYQSKDSNIFKNNQAEDFSYSFAKENNSFLSNDPSNHSLLEDNQSEETASLKERERPFPYASPQESLYSPLTLETLKKPSPKASPKLDTSLNNDTELSQLYKNPYLRNQKPTRPSELIKPPDFTTYKYRDQSPPVRDYDVNRLWSGSRDESSMQMQSKLSPDVGNMIVDSATAKFRDIEKLVRDVEAKRQKDMEYLNAKKSPQIVPFTEGDQSKASKSHARMEESIDDLLFQDAPKREKDVLNDYFDALKINALRSKRVEAKAESTILNVNRETLRNVFNTWIQYSNQHKLKSRGKKVAKAVYTQTLLVRYFSEWLRFHWRIRNFTSKSRSFIRHQSRNNIQFFFDAWKQAVLSNKASRLNRYTAAFFFEKRLGKKCFHAWRNQIITKKSYERLSWEAYLGYRYKLVAKCFKAWNVFQQNKDERNQIKFELMDRSDLLAKRLAFQRFSNQLVEFKDHIEMEKKIFAFYRARSFSQFFKALPDFSIQSKLYKRKVRTAVAFKETVLLKNFFNYLVGHLQAIKNQENYSDGFYYTKLGKKSYFSLKFWSGFNKVPAFQTMGTCVWILYNLLSYCINKRRTSTTGSARQSVRYSFDYSIKGKTPDVSFTDRLMAPSVKEEHLFCLPGYFPLSLNKKYEVRHYEANRTLNLYVEQSLFQFWKKSTQNIRAFKKKNICGFMDTYFSVWKKYSESKMIRKYQLQKYAAKWNKPISSKIFKAWSKVAKEKGILKRLLGKVNERNNLVTMGQQFRQWFRVFKSVRRERDFSKVADEQFMLRYMRKALVAWVTFSQRSKRKSLIQHQFLKRKMDLLQSFAIKGWKLFMDLMAEKRQKERLKDFFFEKHASQKYFKAWKKYTMYKKNCLEMLSLIKIKKRRILTAKIFRRWKKVNLEFKSENVLNEKLHQHYQNIITRKAYFALVAYANVHGSKRRADEIQMQKISSIPMRNFFKRWFKASVHIGALRLFSRLFTILQVKQFFKNLYLKVYKHDMIMTTLEENKGFHVQRIYFNAIKRFAERRMKLRFFQNRFLENKLIKLERNAYIVWRRKYLFEKNVSHLFARSMVDVKNLLLNKYFSVLKKKWFLNSMENYKLKERKIKQKKKLFKGWKNFVKKSAVLTTLFQKEMKRRSLITKKTYLHAIAKRYAKRVHDRKLGEQLKYNRMYKFLSAWVEVYNMKHERSSIRLKPLEWGYESMRLNGTIYNYRAGQKPTKELFFNIKRVYDGYLHQRFFNAWKNFANKSKAEKKKIWIIQTKSGNFAKDLFQVWRDRYVKRRNVRRKLEHFQRQVTHFVYLNVFNNLLAHANDHIKVEILDQKATMFYFNKLKQTAFDTWFNTIRSDLIQRQNLVFAENYYLEKLLKIGFYALVTKYTEKRIKVTNTVRAEEHYINQLRKIPFTAWRNFAVKKSFLKVLSMKFEKLKIAKSAPEVFQRFRMNYYLNLFKKVALPKAEQYYIRMLKIKTFLSFKIASAKKADSREKQNRAALHYFNQLTLKTMRCWLAYLVNKKNKDDLRYNLMAKIQKVDAENLTGFCFNVLKLYKEESQEYLVDLRTIMIENGMRRILQFWKNHCDRKNLSKRVVKQFETFRVQSAKADYFKKWRKAYRMRNLLYTTVRISFLRAFRTYFMEWKKNTQQFGKFAEYSDKVNTQRKAKFWNLWLKFVYEKKMEHKKSLAVFGKQAKKMIESTYFEWRKAFKAKIFDKVRVNQVASRSFYKWRAYLLERKKKQVYVEAANRALVVKGFKSLAEHASQTLQAKTVLAKVLNKKVRKELSYMEVAYQTWLIYVDDCRNEERKTMGAIEYHSKLLMYKSFSYLRKFSVNSAKAKRFLDIVSKFEQEKIPQMIVTRVFNQLKKTSKLERAYYIGCYKIEKALKSATGFFLRLRSNAEYQKRCLLLVEMIELFQNNQAKREALSKIKYTANKIAICLAKSNEYINWKSQYTLKESFFALRDYTAERLHMKINDEKARTFFLERTLPLYIVNVFDAWKEASFVSADSIHNKVAVLQEKIVINRAKECMKKLHNYAQSQRDHRFKTDPTNPRFTGYLDATVHKHYRKYFNKIAQFVETKKRRRELREALIEKFYEMKTQKNLSFYFKVLKSHYYQEKTSTLRYQLYAIFSAWKMHSREKNLLKKYLRESNMPEMLAYTPITAEKPVFGTKSTNQRSMSNTRLSGLSSEFGQTQTMNTGTHNSAVKIERDLMVSSFKNF